MCWFAPIHAFPRHVMISYPLNDELQFEEREVMCTQCLTWYYCVLIRFHSSLQQPVT